MKKLLISVIGLCFLASFTACKPNEDKERIFVDTLPQHKNVLIEEITGIGCGYCPEEHKICDELVAANSGKIFSINIHCGNYANNTPNYKTEEGDAIFNVFKSGGGFPAGYVGRNEWNIKSDPYPVGRGNFSSCAKELLTQPAYMNIAAESTIEKATRKLTVHVQGYFTDLTTETSLINIALIQNNIKGPQSGAADLYPEHVDNQGNYTHNHMLRKMITGTWGEVIPNTGKKSLYSKTFTYTIPSTLGLGSIQTVLEDMEVIVFVTKQNTINGVTCGTDIVNVNKSSMTIK